MTCACKTAPESAPVSPEVRANDTAAAASDCSGAESFALQVLGDDMLPEFEHGVIIIIEPDGALRDGCFVLARTGEEWTFRQLLGGDGAWRLHALNPERTDLPDQPLADLSTVHGVVIQKSVPGRRRLTKFYT